ncbi:uncharacterized protein [Medicago truncatula]|uniref:uncharacterized protein n=1 Tax=Medicago truncatula TaxID=3880 RepID=UPI0019689CC9|nr:uncharacterized protein LOC112418360 [Medicago truncatula]
MCSGVHPTGYCPPHLEEEVNYVGNQQRQGQFQGQYSRNANQQRFPNNNNFQRGNNFGQPWKSNVGPSNQQPFNNNFQQYPPQQDRTQKIEDTLNQFMQLTMANQQNNTASIKNLETQMGQQAQHLSQISQILANQQGGNVTANTQNNPSITTRSGKVIGQGIGNNLEVERHIVDNEEEVESEKEEEDVHSNEEDDKNVLAHKLPYPKAQSKKDLEKHFKRFLDIFKRLEIKLPFSEALEQLPTYAKFLKEILSKKRRYKDDETIQLDANCSAIIQRHLPKKEKNPGRVTLPVAIGNVNVGKDLIDLGSNINLISYSVVKRVGGLEMKLTRMTLQLADKSVARPMGIAEDVLVKVDKFVFPVDFVVMDIEEEDEMPLILGRTFMLAARMMIDYDDGLMKVRLDDEEINSNLHSAMKHSKDKGACFKVDAMHEVIMDTRKQLHKPTALERVLIDALSVLSADDEKEIEECLKELETLKEIPPKKAKVEELKEKEKVEESKNEFKVLPSHLKYVFLEEDDTKPVIISNSLSSNEEDKLIEVLK